MSIYTDVQEALSQFVVDNLPSGFKVVRENERYKPVVGVPYATLTLIPATTTRETLGAQGKFQYSGLFQVSFFVPAQTGVVANDLVDQLCEAVQEQPLFDIGSTALHLRQVTRLTAMTETDLFHLPCRIEWWAYV